MLIEECIIQFRQPTTEVVSSVFFLFFVEEILLFFWERHKILTLLFPLATVETRRKGESAAICDSDAIPPVPSFSGGRIGGGEGGGPGN